MDKVINVTEEAMVAATNEPKVTNGMTVFEVLSTRDIKKYVNDKGGNGKLSYLPWNHAWAIVKKYYPDANLTIYKNEMGWNYFTDTKTCWVDVGVTINGLEHRITRPVYGDKPNVALPYDKVTADKVWNSIARCIVKCCALHGLGIQLWSGTTDEVSWDASSEVEKKQKAESSKEKNITPPAPSPKTSPIKDVSKAPAVETPKTEVQEPDPQTATPATPTAPAPNSAQLATPQAPQSVEMATPQTATAPLPSAPAHQFVSNGDAKLLVDGGEVLEFVPRDTVDVATAKTADFFISDPALKNYAHLTCDQAFGKMIKDLDLDALKRLAQFLTVPDEQFAMLTDAQKLSLNAIATVAQVKLSKAFTWPVKK